MRERDGHTHTHNSYNKFGFSSEWSRFSVVNAVHLYAVADVILTPVTHYIGTVLNINYSN